MMRTSGRGAALSGLVLLAGALVALGCGDEAQRAQPGSTSAVAPTGGPANVAPATALPDAPTPATASSSPAPWANADVPAPMRECHQCHRNVVETYLRHGMADSLGPLPVAPRGELVNPTSGTRYTLEPDASGGTLTATFADGGRRRQRLVGRIGAGRLDTSFVGTELDADGRSTNRLFFTPLEWITGHGLALAPFELDPSPAGLDRPVTARCLECHTGDLPAREPYPRNRLGDDALHRLRPLDCSACHGDTTRHADLMLDRAQPTDADDIGLARLSELPAPEQRDRCARCHLEGDANLELAPRSHGGDQPGEPSVLARRPALVPARSNDDFRFVGQLERLALSACFRESPSMTCTSCHLPHTAVYEQGPVAFDAACMRCHVDACSRPATLTVPQVSGAPARSAEGCIDCHVRRSQPFDIPGLVTADHFVRSRIPLPSTAPARTMADPGGPLAVFDDGRLAPALATEGGRRWSQGLAALGYVKQGRMSEAATVLATFPAPGSDAARIPSAPPGLPPLESCADFHHLRGVVLEATGDRPGAAAAYGDALACDPGHPEARLNRAAARLSLGQPQLAAEDAAVLATAYPQAEKPQTLRSLLAAQAGDIDAQLAALRASLARWPSDARLWQTLGRLELARGDAQAAHSLQRAAELAPALPGLAQELDAARGR